MYFIFQANLCFVDLETQTVQLPEDLLNFPDRSEFISDIIDLLDQYNIPAHSCYRLALLLDSAVLDVLVASKI